MDHASRDNEACRPAINPSDARGHVLRAKAVVACAQLRRREGSSFMIALASAGPGMRLSRESASK